VSRWTSASPGGREAATNVLDDVLPLGQELAELAPAARGLKLAGVLQALVLG
jgi:hypothetical protein